MGRPQNKTHDKNVSMGNDKNLKSRSASSRQKSRDSLGMTNEKDEAAKMMAESAPRAANEPTLRIRACGTRKDKNHGEILRLRKKRCAQDDNVKAEAKSRRHPQKPRTSALHVQRGCNDSIHVDANVSSTRPFLSQRKRAWPA